MAVIEELGFSDYFLIVADIVRFAKNAGIAVGPGRGGSAAGSLTAYCLGITDVDPLQWGGLLFERFLNKARRSRPDIDLDFVMKGEARYWLMWPSALVESMWPKLGLTAHSAGAPQPKKSRGCMGGSTRGGSSNRGIKRHRSTHAAGVIVTGPPVQNISAVYTDRHMPVTHLDMYSLEALGVLKIDLLGLRTLTLLQRIEAEIGRSSPDFSLGSIPLQDRAAFELLGRGGILWEFFSWKASCSKICCVRCSPPVLCGFSGPAGLRQARPAQDVPGLSQKSAAARTGGICPSRLEGDFRRDARPYFVSRTADADRPSFGRPDLGRSGSIPPSPRRAGSAGS